MMTETLKPRISAQMMLKMDEMVKTITDQLRIDIEDLSTKSPDWAEMDILLEHGDSDDENFALDMRDQLEAAMIAIVLHRIKSEY